MLIRREESAQASTDSLNPSPSDPRSSATPRASFGIIKRSKGDAFVSVDETGVVIMETHDEPETIVEKVEGVQYEKGIINKHFITDKEKAVAELDNPCVLIVESK